MIQTSSSHAIAEPKCAVQIGLKCMPNGLQGLSRWQEISFALVHMTDGRGGNMIPRQELKKCRLGPPYCSFCHHRPVKILGELCFFCREEKKDVRSMVEIVAIFLTLSLIAAGLFSAYGTWIKLNR